MRLLTVAAMRRVDAAAIDGGVPGLRLMEAAGAAVAARARACRRARKTVVLCGPGKTEATASCRALLAEAGYGVDLVLLGERAALKGDAALAAQAWTGPVRQVDGSPLPSATS